VSDRLIPLEDVSDFPEGPTAFTDVILALYLEGLPVTEDEDGDPAYEAGPLADAVVGVFALGCALGVEFPDRVATILGQTHPEGIEHIIEECREPLAERVAASRAGGEALAAEEFIEDLVHALDDDMYADNDTALNALSIAFEYGCVVAHLERSAAILVRNAQNRDRRETLEELEAGDEVEPPEGPDPYQSLQELAAEIMSAYEADIGFGES
jgi:hypothetical protein